MTDSPEANSVYSGELSNWEYHGVLAHVLGVRFSHLTQKQGHDPFYPYAQRQACSGDITQRLKIDTKAIKERTAEPTPELAWKYVTAYFEGAREAAFGLVDRTSFETRLRAHLEGYSKNEDPAWYALRNAIYATGCRLELSKTGKFRHAFQTSWTYFSNCLSVHLELLYFQTSIMAIQALTIMGYFSDSIGRFCLEYMLSTVALRLACSKGLHRQAASSWNMSREEKELRNRIFWAAYCLEKNCAARSGRPSMIDDDQISCSLPQKDHGEGSSNSQFAITVIKLAQMSSLTSKRLTLIETHQQSAEVLVRTVTELDQKLKTLASHIQKVVDLDSPLEPGKPGQDIDLQQAIYIRMAYYTIVLDVHTPLSYPWSQRLFNLQGDPDLQLQVQASSETVIQTARKAAMATQFVRLDACTSILIGFHCPLYALINMFVHILEDTQRSTVQSNLSLLDIGVSHFLRVEFNSESEVSQQFPKEVAQLARQAVESSNSGMTGSVEGSGVLNLLGSIGHGEKPGLNNWVDPMGDVRILVQPSGS
ncbi:hypothetical protein CEP52_015423 [Fusarium oligoseptatum]|uniref:Xylanolytic transcriptional activator regulatory domain-containing protein n=1 Tax=Fusarium oligoseptatum TaxID=2604345 RepID=A0A428SDA9_9HYPO|nr:hypothetical protein CEP52_015423 [Fusarium oligoseptatum]